MTYTLKDLQNRFKELGYKWPSGLHLVGIRSKSYIPNTFCDNLYLVNGGQLFVSKGTTRPGSYYLLHLLNPSGTAVLKPGQYENCWKLGLHRGKYEAWTQIRPVTVFRDKDKDIYAETIGKEESGLFGINIHRSNEFTISKLVDKYSAGCQVFADPKDFNRFITLSKQSENKEFTYTLLEEF